MNSNRKYRIHLVAINPEGYSLALGYLHAALINEPYLSDRIDVFSFVYDIDDVRSPYYDLTNLISEITQSQPDVIGFSTYLWNAVLIKEIARIVNKLFPETKIVLGGPQFRGDGPENWDQCPENALIVLGEGENTFLSLVKAFLTCGTTDIPGVVARHGGEWKFDVSSPEPVNLEKLCSPIEKGTLVYNPSKWVPSYSTSRGCIYNCAYCLWGDGKGMRYFPLETVRRDLEAFRKKRVKRIWFTDCLFGAEEERYCTILDWLSEWPKDCRFGFETRAEFLTQKIVRGFSQINVDWIAVGVQTMNFAALRSVNRILNVDELIDHISRLRECLANNPQAIHLDLIFGLPEDSIGDICRTIDWLHERFPEVTLFFELLRVLPGTGIWKRACNENWCFHSPERFYELIENKAFPFRDIVQVKQIGLGLDFLQLRKSRPWVKEVLSKTGITFSDLCRISGEFLGEIGIGSHHESYRYRYLEKILEEKNINRIYSKIEAITNNLKVDK